MMSSGLMARPSPRTDVVFTWQYCTHPEAGCVQSDEFDGVVSVEAMGMHQVTITYDAPKPFPYQAFVSQTTPILQKAQFGECIGAEMTACTEQNFAPIGTGTICRRGFPSQRCRDLRPQRELP